MIAAMMLISLAGGALGILVMLSPILRQTVRAHRWAVFGYGLSLLFVVGTLAGMAEFRRASFFGPTSHVDRWRYTTIALAVAAWATTCATVVAQGIRKKRERDKGKSHGRLEDMFDLTRDGD